VVTAASPLVAIEEHWMLPELAAALDGHDESLALNRRGDHEQRLADLADGRLAAMDEQGIDVSIIALTPPGTQALGADDAVRLSRAANDTAAAAVARHPHRFRALSTLPLSAPDAAATELQRAADLGLVGTMVYSHAGQRLIDDPVYDELWATAAQLRQPVFLHPQIPSDATRAAVYRGFDATTDLALATFGWGWHVDTATAALRLILRGTFERHPDLQLVLGHWGELLLFWLDRVDALSRVAGLPHTVSDYVRSNVHVTASGMLDPAKLRHVLTVTTPDRLLFSTDYPFQQPTRDAITTFLDVFPDAHRALFTTRNAAALFGLDL
jgi:predicted TIM-barrel fold metal-dependent hydrolase